MMIHILAIVASLLLPAALAPAGAFRVATPIVPALYAYQPADCDGPMEQPIAISAARREIEPFALLIITDQQPIENVQVAASDLAHETSVFWISAAMQIEIAPLAYVRASVAYEESDPLRLEQLDRGQVIFEPRILRRDLQSFDVAANSQQMVWVTIAVPVDAPAGQYHGEVRVTCGDDVRAIPLHLQVYDFTLPAIPTMPALTKWSPVSYDAKAQAEYPKPDEMIDAYARFMIKHRWRPGRIYQSGVRPDSVAPPTAESIRRWRSFGGTDINLMRVDRSEDMSDLVMDAKTGGASLAPAALGDIWRSLDQRVPAIREAGLLDACYIYGFDEVPRRYADLITQVFGQIKQRYGDVRTVVTMCDWTALEEPRVRNVDWWLYTKRWLTPELRDFHHQRGEKIGMYNDFDEPLLPARVALWAAYKDGIDTMLFYSMGDQSAFARVANEPFPLIDKPDRAALHHLPDGPTSTLILESWRDGLEDVDYLWLLRRQIDRLRNAYANRESPDIARLLAEADYFANVPDAITQGAMAEARAWRASFDARDIIGRDEAKMVRAMLLSRTRTDSLTDVMQSRHRIAELIMRLSRLRPEERESFTSTKPSGT